ncbi:MAG TPA: YceI family protein [Rhodanobacteraceae bacterium]|nr:YceI family protein [Rhodanobacteraceae bacterium]
MKAALALVWCCLPGLAAAAATPVPQNWTIDPAQSQVQFSVRKFWVVHVRGTFPGLRGSLREIDARIGASMGKVDATLDVTKLRMDSARDRRYALGTSFFDAARYPAIHFDSDPFPLGKLATGGTLRGSLSLHGERHPVTLALLPSDCPRQPLECAIHVQGSISRSSFGMRGWRGVLSNKVMLDLRIVVRSSMNAASSARQPDSGQPGR